MAQVIVMPQAGNTVETCILVGWQVSVGDEISEGTILCEAETDKSTVDVEATASGTVLALLAEEGDEVPVKDPIVLVGEAGEDVEAAKKELGIVGSAASAPAEEAPAPAAEPTPEPEATPQAAPAPAAATPAAAAGSGAASPRARRAAASSGVDLAAVGGSGPHGRVIESDVLAAAAAGPGLTTGAKATGTFAADSAAGTGLGGRLTRADLASGAAAPTVAPTGAPAAELPFPGEFEDTPLKGIRKLVAERMMGSLRDTAQVTFNVSANAAGLLALRKRCKNAPEALGLGGITIGDLVGYATVRTLLNYPVLNATLQDNTLRTYAGVHLGLAVDTPRGLMVPTIRNAHAMGIRQYSAVSKELAAQCMEGKIDPDLLQGGTFTVSNLGAFGMESFTPVLNPPQTGILGVNTIMPRPAVNAEGEVVVEKRLGLSLTADHQVVDGADAARFLKDLVAAIENIDLTVMG